MDRREMDGARRLLFGVAVVCSVGGAGLAATLTATAAGAEATITIPVSGHLHAVTDAVPQRSLCDAQGGAFAAGQTDVIESGTSTITGTFLGTGRFCGFSRAAPGLIRPDGAVTFRETDVFTGLVHGCGTGSVTYTVTGTIGAIPNAATQGLPTDEDWQIVARSGSSGLRGLVSGRGHDVGQINADSSIDTDFTGAVQCAQSDVAATAAGGSSRSTAIRGFGALPDSSSSPGALAVVGVAIIVLAYCLILGRRRRMRTRPS